jgi:hypothetical protein
VIRTTNNAAVGIASKIGGGSYRYYCGYFYKACCGHSYINRACAGGAYIDRASINRAYIDKAYSTD